MSRTTQGFPDLPAGGQLFTHVARELAAGQLGKPVVAISLQRMFDAHRFAEGLELVRGTIAALVAVARRPIVFNIPQSPVLLPDEESCLDCLGALQVQTDRCACRYLSEMVQPSLLGAVMPCMVGTARLFASRELAFRSPTASPPGQSPELRLVH